MGKECEHRKWLERSLPPMSQLNNISCPWCTDRPSEPKKQSLAEKLYLHAWSGMDFQSEKNYRCVQLYREMAQTAISHVLGVVESQRVWPGYKSWIDRDELIKKLKEEV